jgi:phenylalanyl-tRNA synthetase beta chain
VDFYYLKGICSAICNLAGVAGESTRLNHPRLSGGLEIKLGDTIILRAGEVESDILRKFDIRQPVFFADIYWDNLLKSWRKSYCVYGITQAESGIPRPGTDCGKKSAFRND